MIKESGEGRRRPAESAPDLDSSKREQCPRCDSRDTKFCYYNNYNTSQPRHFCKACRRYWTLGGSLRNVPIGGSSRKRLRTASSVAKASLGVGGAVHGSALEIPVGGFGSFLAEPLLALGEPFLDGRTGFELGLGLGLGSWAGPASPGMDELGLSFGLGTTQLLWPTSLLEEEGMDTWKVRSGGGECFAAPAVAIWQDLAVSSSAEGNGGPGMRLA